MALQVIVAGLGPRGCDWVREIRASSNFAVVACVDPDERVQQAASEELKIPPEQCFRDLKQAITEVKCDAMIVATAAETHAAACELALAHGIALLVEKPFTLRLNEAKCIVELAARQNVPVLVAQNYRYMRAFRAARKVISGGALGKIRFVSCQYFRPPHEMAASLRRLEHSVLYGMGVHHLDALRYVLGQEVVNASAESFRTSESSPCGASFRAMLSFSDGTRANYFATYESSGYEFFERGQQFYARFVGERATLHIFQRWLILCEQKKLPRLLHRGPRTITEEQLLLQQLEHAIRTGDAGDASGHDNLQTMAILEACIRSATEQRSINPQSLLHE